MLSGGGVVESQSVLCTGGVRGDSGGVLGGVSLSSGGGHEGGVGGLSPTLLQ